MPLTQTHVAASGGSALLSIRARDRWSQHILLRPRPRGDRGHMPRHCTSSRRRFCTYHSYTRPHASTPSNWATKRESLATTNQTLITPASRAGQSRLRRRTQATVSCTSVHAERVHVTEPRIPMHARLGGTNAMLLPPPNVAFGPRTPCLLHLHIFLVPRLQPH